MKKEYRQIRFGFFLAMGAFVFNVVVVFFFSFFLSNCSAPRAQAEDTPHYKIAIIDTGYDPARATVPLKLCKTGHYDYFTKTANLNFRDAHGTRVANLIAEKLKNVNYCAVIYQTATLGTMSTANDRANALNLAIGEQVVAINMSIQSDPRTSDVEREAFKFVSEARVAIFVAAGNNGDGYQGKNLDKNCNIYPVCYGFKDLVVVGAQDPENPKEHALSSNYGKKRVDIWAPGYYEDATDSAFGTSYAAPRALAEYILFLDSKRKK